MRQFSKKFTMLAALSLAAVFSAGSLPALGADARPQLVFTSGRTNEEIITGESLDIRETASDGYVFQNMEVLDGGTLVDDGFTLELSNGSGSVGVSGTFKPDNGDKTYSLLANYYAILAEGTVTEANTSASMSGTVESLTNQAITSYSTCTLRCTSSQEGVNPPAFALESPTGSFQKFAGGSVSVIERTQNSIQVRISKGGEEIVLQFSPKLPHREDDGTVNYNIQEGTTFTMEFVMPQSNPLLLRVLTPQAAMDIIEGQIRQSSGQSAALSETQFIRLASGDALDYITDDFTLRQYTNQFNARFRVEWSWDPDDTQASGATGDLQGVVQFGKGNTDLQTATIHPLEDDVSGTLVATVSYSQPGGGWLESKTGPVSKEHVVIRGTGLPVDVTREQQSTAGADPETEIFDDEELRTSITMDAYSGGIDEATYPNFHVTPRGPYQYVLNLDMGAKNGTAQYAVVDVTGDTGAITLQTQQGSSQAEDYTSGGRITNEQFDENDNTNNNIVQLIINAVHVPEETGSRRATLDISFWIPDRNGTPQKSSRTFTVNLTVYDSTPSQDSALSAITIRDQEGDILNEDINFPFSPDRLAYTGPNMIHLPYRVTEITLTPTLRDPRGNGNPITINLATATNAPVGDGSEKVMSGNSSEPVLLDGTEEIDVGDVLSVTMLVPSQDPRPDYWSTYELEIVRDPASTDASLASLGIYLPEDTQMAQNLINFDPDVREYRLVIPFSTQRLRVRAEANDPAAGELEIIPSLQGSSWVDRYPQWLNNLPELFDQNEGQIDLTVKVTAEDGETERTYTVSIQRSDPSTDATLKTLEVLDREENTLTYRPAFRPDTNTYSLDIPYSTRQVRFLVDTTDPNVSEIEVYSLNTEGEPVLTLSGGQIKLGAASNPVDVRPINDAAIIQQGHHPFIIRVIAENGETQREYEVRVMRAQPSEDDTLKSLTIQDQDGQPINLLAFHPDQLDYPITVPYEVTRVSFTPTANDPNATIRVEEGGLLGGLLGSDVESGSTSRLFNLDDPGVEKQFNIEVTAEDGGDPRVYTVRFTREQPSNDARLKRLEVQNVDDFEPVFVSNRTDYTATVSEGSAGVIITATANHPGATIRIDGYVVASGQPSDLLELIEEEQEVEILVTAQDGVTTMTYTINFTNPNLIEKSSNADLRRLTVNYGLMTPEFQPAITEYEVTVAEDTWSVDILPRLSDPMATMRVMAGTREIGDYNGNYAQALEDGENPISIEVTSPDETVTKTYTVNIYRNEDDKLKNLTPLEAEDIDFENSGDVILVMIDEYPRVGASVFNELRNYPEKTIIFQGNDYSLEFKASDLDRVVPQREIFDFRLSFTSPDEDAIYDLIERRSANDDIDSRVVMVYFPQEASLPGPATFHLSLGRRYADDTLYWHYYNKERDRIDYYGALESNSQGTIAVTIDHFSTYVISPRHRIAGSEDRAGNIDELGMVSDGSDVLEPTEKLFPNTGVKEG